MNIINILSIDGQCDLIIKFQKGFSSRLGFALISYFSFNSAFLFLICLTGVAQICCFVSHCSPFPKSKPNLLTLLHMRVMPYYTRVI